MYLNSLKVKQDVLSATLNKGSLMPFTGITFVYLGIELQLSVLGMYVH